MKSIPDNAAVVFPLSNDWNPSGGADSSDWPVLIVYGDSDEAELLVGSMPLSVEELRNLASLCHTVANHLEEK